MIDIEKEQFVEYGGFVKNEETGEYDLLFDSKINSESLMREFTISAANERNLFCRNKYNLNDVVIKQRKKTIITEDWVELASGSSEELEERTSEIKKILEDGIKE